MKKIFIISLCFTAMSFSYWQSDFENAKQRATETHRLIMLNFSGSDWCGPCIRMRKEIFDNDLFLKMADTSLVLVNADFPRNKKNQLTTQLKKQNEALADQYNPDGKFPYTLLLDAKGNIIKTWEGLPNENATQFTRLIKSICDAHK